MPSFSDSIFLFVLALLLFGPKKLPVLAREIGKWVGEFRRASNEFKMQMEDELRQSEQADRLKKIEAMEAAAPKSAEISEKAGTEATETPTTPLMSDETAHERGTQREQQVLRSAQDNNFKVSEVSAAAAKEEINEPLPIAEAGEVKIMLPATGLPTPRSGGTNGDVPKQNALGGLLDSIPVAEKNSASAHADAAETVHGN